jgi:hypothetical protein
MDVRLTGFQSFRDRDRIGIERLRALPAREVVSRLGGTWDATNVRIPEAGAKHVQLAQEQLRALGRHVLEPLLRGIDLSRWRRIIIVRPPLLPPSLPLHGAVLSGGTFGAIANISEIPSITVLAELLDQEPVVIRKATLVACDPTGRLSEHTREIRGAFHQLRDARCTVLSDLFATSMAQTSTARVFASFRGIGAAGGRRYR